MSAAPTAKRRAKSGGHEEEHESHERWLITYADMITLLMVLFIVLFAISQVDQKKFNALKEGLASGFGTPVAALDGGPGPMEEQGIGPQPLDLLSDVLTPPGSGAADAKTADAKTKAAVAAADQARRARELAQAQREVGRLEKARARIERALRARGMQGAVLFRMTTRGLVVSIIADRVIFPADRAELAPGGRTVLDAVAPALRELPNDLAVEGHTNTAPVKPKYYPTEWELSTARAVNVLRYLVESHRVPAGRLQAAGYADQRPLLPGHDARANTLNRRVEIVVLSSAPAASRALLPEAAADTSHSDNDH